ncbi:hypothetical protein RAS1_16080 [Phycisphaerae bacterium RAS1]|nr:hypothetical protein RAS1_16080 [Phycisphaerae bacterium RAS1]
MARRNSRPPQVPLLSRRERRVARSCVTAVFAAACLTGCTAPQPSERQVGSEPRASRPAPPPRIAATQSASVPSQSSTSATASAVPTPTPTPPELLEYVVIVRRWRDGQAAQAVVRTEADDHLFIETENVRRIRIERALLPLSRARSIALLLDGQPFEWTVGSRVSDFEQDGSGVWRAVPDR